MSLKFKQNKNVIKKVCAWAFLALVFLIVLSFSAFSTAQAAVLKPSDIQIQFDTQTMGPQGMQNDNIIRLGPGDALKLNGVIKVTSPTAGVAIGTDQIDLGSNQSITSFGIGADPVDQNQTNGGGTDCTSSTKRKLPFTSNVSYLTCDFSGGTASAMTSGTITSQTFSLTLNASSLGLDSTKYKTAQALMVYPYMGFASWGLNYASVFDKVGKRVYVIYYATAQEAQQAIANGDRAGVAAYGSTSGTTSFKNTDDSFLLGLINKIIMFLLGLVNEIVYFIFYWLIAPLIQALLSIHTYKDNFVNVIYPGWEVIRNVCNIFFIVAIIGIALATLFRLEGYQYRHLLVQLILAALLVNFSLVIAQAILSLADTIQSQFLPNNVDVIRSLARDLMVANTRDAIWNLDVSKYGQFSQIVISFFWVALAIGSFAVFAGLCAYLVIRVVMLWILLMVSPIAFVGGILPSTAGLRTQWWEYFLKYAFFTPIIAFFLNITAYISNQVRGNRFLQDLTAADFSQSNLGELNAFIFKVGGNIMILVFLMVAIKVAEEMGIYGAAAISEVANKGVMMPFNAAAWGINNRLSALNRWRQEKGAHLLEEHEGGRKPGLGSRLMFAVTNPDAIYKGWRARTKEIEHMAGSLAEARGREVSEQFRTTPIKRLIRGKWEPQLNFPYAQFAERKEEDGFVKEYQNMSKERMMAAAIPLETMGGAEGAIRRRALIKAAASQGVVDDLLRMHHFANKYADKGVDGKGAAVYSAEAVNRFLYGYMGNDEQAMRVMDEDIEDYAQKTKHFDYMGHAFYNPETKKYENGFVKTGNKETVRGIERDVLQNVHQARYAASEFAKLGGRQRVEAAPHNFQTLSVMTDKEGYFLDKNGNRVTDGNYQYEDEVFYGRPEGERMDAFNRSMLSKMDASVLREVQHSQERIKTWLISAKRDLNTGEIILESNQEFDRLKQAYDSNEEYIKGIYGRMLGYDVTKELPAGIKISVVDKDLGKIDKSIGYADTIKTPIAENIASEFPKINPPRNAPVSSSLREESFSELVKKVVDKDEIEKLYVGHMSKDQLQQKIKARISKIDDSKDKSKYADIQGNLDELSAEMSDKVFDMLGDQAHSKFNSAPFVDELEKKYKFSSNVSVDLSRALAHAPEQAFHKAAGEKRAVKTADFRSFVADAFMEAKTKAQGQDKDIFDQISQQELEKIIGNITNHMTPVKNTPATSNP